MNPPPESPTSARETARVEAFSDGVFAIAITLLVLNMHVPRVDEAPSGFNLLWWHASRARLLDPRTDAAQVRAVRRQYGWGPALYGVSFFSAAASITILSGLMVFFVLPMRRGPAEEERD